MTIKSSNGKDALFTEININQDNYNGWLSKEKWEWIRNHKHI